MKISKELSSGTIPTMVLSVVKSDDNGKYKDSSGKVYTKAVETSWDRDGSILVQTKNNSSSFSLFEY